MIEMVTHNGLKFWITKDINETELPHETDKVVYDYFLKYFNRQMERCGYYILDEYREPVEVYDDLEDCIDEVITQIWKKKIPR